MKSLADLAVGEAGIVREVEAARGTRRRLLELGLLPGTRVEVLRRAPLGDPLVVRLRAYSLSIRKREAARVVVDSPEVASGEEER